MQTAADAPASTIFRFLLIILAPDS
jgi:hypothetical protein